MSSCDNYAVQMIIVYSIPTKIIIPIRYKNGFSKHVPFLGNSYKFLTGVSGAFERLYVSLCTYFLYCFCVGDQKELSYGISAVA